MPPSPAGQHHSGCARPHWPEPMARLSIVLSPPAADAPGLRVGFIVDDGIRHHARFLSLGRQIFCAADGGNAGDLLPRVHAVSALARQSVATSSWTPATASVSSDQPHGVRTVASAAPILVVTAAARDGPE